MTPPKQEIISEKLVDEIVDASASPVANRLENLKKSMKPIDDVAAPKERKEALNMLKQTIDRKTMNEIQKKMIMEQVDEKIQMIDAQLQALEKREQELEAQVKEAGPKEKGAVEKVLNALPEVPTGVKMAAAGLGLVGVWFIAKKIFGKAKDTAKAGADGVKKGIMNFWAFLGIGVVAVAGAFGASALMKYGEQMRGLKEQADKMEAAAKELAAQAKATAIAGKEKTVATAQAAKDIDTQSAPAVKEAAKETAKTAAALATPSAMLALDGNSFKWEQLDTREGHRSLRLADVIFQLQNKPSIRMKDVFECGTSAEKIKELCPPVLDQKDSEEITRHNDAARFFVTFCINHREQMEAMLQRSDPAVKIEELSLQECFEKCLGSVSVLGEFLADFKDKGQEIFTEEKHWEKYENLAGRGGALAGEMKLFVRELNDGKESGPDIDSLLSTVLTSAGSTNVPLQSFYNTNKDILSKPVSTLTAEEKSKRMLVLIAENIRTTPPDILPFFHGNFILNGKNDVPTNRRYLLDTMPFRQAIRFALYDRMVRGSGNAAALAMMQFEAMRFTAQNDNNTFQSTVWTQGLTVLDKWRGEGTENIINEYKNLDPTMREKLKRGIVQTAGGIIAVTGIVGASWLTKATQNTASAVVGGLNFLKDKAIKNPVETGAIFAGTEIARRSFNAFENVKIENQDFIEALQNTSKRKGGAWLRRSKALVVSRNEAHGALKTLNQSLSKGRNINSKMSQMQELLNNFLKSNRTADALMDLKKGIITMGEMTPEIEKAINAVNTPNILTTLQKFRIGDRIISGTIRTVTLNGILNTDSFKSAIKLTKLPIDTVMASLKGISAPPALLSKFLATPNALQMLVKAAANGGTKAATAVINLGGRALSLVGKAGTALAVPFDVAICLVEVLEAKKQIAGTDNESIKDIYKEDINFNVATTTIGAASTFVAGAFATAGTLAALPIALAAMGTKYTHKQLRDAALTWVKDDRDYAKETDAVLMQKLQDLAPGNFGGLGGGIVYSIDYLDKKDGRTSFNQAAEESFKGIQDANAGARFNICRALVVRNAFIAPSENESAQEFQNKFDRQVMDEMQYIGNKTQGKFDLTNPDLFLQAKRHADLLAMSRVAKQSNESPKLEWKDGDKTESFDIKDYEDLWKKSDNPAENIRREALRSRLPEEYRKQVDVPMKLIAINAKLEDGKDAAPLISQALLQDLTIPLSKLDAQINATDFPGMWDGVTDHYDRDLSRYMAFSGIADTLDEAVADAIENGEMSVEEYDLAMQKVRSKLQSSPLDHFKAGQLAKPNIESFRNKDDLLTPNGILAALFERQESLSKAA